MDPRPHERPTEFINVPARSTENAHNAFFAGHTPEDAFLVGSPDQYLDNSTASAPRRPTSSFNHGSLRSALPSASLFGTPHSRPSLGSRSSSSPLTARRRPPSSANRVTSGLFRMSSPPPQWSLFSQLMENEGQLRTPSVMSRRTEGMEYIEHDPFLETSSPTSDDRTGRPSSRLSSLYEMSDSDSDSDSESDDVPSSSWFSPLSTVQRNILKCAIAYFVASLFTFSPYLSGFISDLTSYGPGLPDSDRVPVPSGHMVATIAVYFNPAKTIGGMIEADLFCLIGLLYSSFVCLASMSLFWWLEVRPGWEWAADAVAIIWIGVSMSVVAWSKVYMGNPSFNTACSMMAIIIFVVLVKEGGFQTLIQVTAIVLIGSTISNLICYIIWPQSATMRLREGMGKSLDSFSTVLGMLVGVFLGEDELEEEQATGRRHRQKATFEKMQRAVEGHQSSFTSLKKHLEEARSEWGLERGEGEAGGAGRKRAYEDAVDSLNRLGQHLNGLRSGTRLQYELGRTPSGVDMDTVEDAIKMKAAADMFRDLVEDLGPPLLALSSACTSSLSRLRKAFVQSTSHPDLLAGWKGKSRSSSRSRQIKPHEFSELAHGIERALVRFESTSNHAVLRLYRRSAVEGSGVSVRSETASVNTVTEDDDIGTSKRKLAERKSEREKAKDNVILTGDASEHVFLVYFFIFTLQEFSGELVSLVDAMRRIYVYEQARVTRKSWFKRIWGWCRRDRHGQTNGGEGDEGRRRPGLKRSLSSYILQAHRHRPPAFPKIRPHAPNTMQTPSRSALSFMGRVGQSIWGAWKRLGQRDAKYAIKAGMATAMLAAPAFWESTRTFFVEYWGDWALISFFVVISPTIGATNYLGLQRVLGTLFGAAVAAGIYTAFPDDAVVLSIFGFFFSLPCFYFAVAKPQYLSASRFVLLTYNLTCLYCYNLRQKDVSVFDVAFHRALAVTAGVVWAAIVSRFWWPAEARRELGEALGDFCLNIGWLYTRLVASNSFAPEYPSRPTSEADTDARRLTDLRSTKLNSSIQEFMAMELHLQIKLIELQGLLAQTQHEPRLKGPFPVQLYRGMLTSLQTILDKLHSMRCVTTREEWYTSVRQDFIIPVNKERHEMVGNIILSFSTLASAFRLKAPLPPYLPPAEKSRQRLVDAIRNLDVVRNRDVKGSRQLLFFAYALSMKGVTQELEQLGRTLQEAFGVIGQTREEFDALFMTPAEMERGAFNIT